jgi:hypothetical protein
MADNTNVNNNAAVVVVGRTAPVPPGQQKSEKSIPVVIANDQSTIPVAEQNKIQSEVALSLLGIPRSEVALGIFADVNTYDVNPTEWSATPEQYSTVANSGVYAGIAQSMGWGLTHIPEESGALIEAPADKTAVLTSKRFFRYQPGRVSAATFGVKTTSIGNTGSNIQNPCVRKYGIFDNYDGYYWESRNNGSGDNFCVVRRTQSIIYENPIPFGGLSTQQSQDYGRTNPQDPLAPRGSESENNATALQNPAVGGRPKKFGDLVILRDGLIMTHAAVYDPSLLQNESRAGITSVYNGNIISLAGFAKTVTNATYDIDTGLMVITTSTPHGFEEGKFVTLAGIGMTCYLNPTTPISYPNRTPGYNVLVVNSSTSFTVNIGISTVPTFYNSGGHVIGLSTNQYVSYSKGTNSGIITGFTDTGVYRVTSVGVNTITGITTVRLSELNGNPLTGIATVSGISSHVLITPVPFIQPLNPTTQLNGNPNAYGTVKPTGMFPYMYEEDGSFEGYIDTRETDTDIIKLQIDAINNYYGKWVNHNVKKDYWNVYEYRVPRSRFSGDRLDNVQDGPLIYSDVVSSNLPGQPVIDPTTGDQLTDSSIWNLDFTKVTMYKVEFSWYGAVGALFLAYVPVESGEARWVRVHHLRASNQLKVSSLGNATLPITYLVYGGGNQNRYGYQNTERPASTFNYGSSSEHIVKYGASYYIDGGDRGTVKLFSYSTPTSQSVYGSRRLFYVNNGGGVGVAATQVDLTNATSTTDPYITVNSGIITSFYVGSKVITTNALDQNIEVTYGTNQRLYLNSPLSSSSLATITVVPNRPVPIIGIKCRDYIQSSTGKLVRNRTQVYPIRLSTGSTGVLKVDLVKSPIFQTTSSTTGTPPSLSVDTNIGKRGKPTTISVSNTSYLSTNTGIYGYYRGYYLNDPSKKLFSVLGYLENRGLEGYYFYSLNSYSDEIILVSTGNPFLKEENTNSIGEIVSPLTTEFTLAQLSSIKVNPQVRSPIPNTGTIVASLFIPASGEEYDLSPYFDYNKEYLSFPLTNKVESLYLCVSSQSNYTSESAAADISASLTWEEQ